MECAVIKAELIAEGKGGRIGDCQRTKAKAIIAMWRAWAGNWK
jgi:hypothetical protein